MAGSGLLGVGLDRIGTLRTESGEIAGPRVASLISGTITGSIIEAGVFIVTGAGGFYNSGGALRTDSAVQIGGGLSLTFGGLNVSPVGAPASQAFGAATAFGTSGLLTFTVTTAAATTQTAVINNGRVTASSQVVATITSYSGTMFTNGIPYVTIENVALGQFTVRLTNLHATNALSGTLKISFLVVN
jgi:hypothetical protein